MDNQYLIKMRFFAVVISINYKVTEDSDFTPMYEMKRNGWTVEQFKH